MFTKKFKQGFERYGVAKHTFISVFSCVLLFICGVLSSSLEVQAYNGLEQQRSKATSASNRKLVAKVKQDPTRPPSVIVQQLAEKVDVDPEYQLTAIFMRNEQHYAIVNGNIVKAGDNIANMYIKEITPTNLTMKNTAENNSDMVLKLTGTPDIKKQVIQP